MKNISAKYFWIIIKKIFKSILMKIEEIDLENHSLIYHFQT